MKKVTAPVVSSIDPTIIPSVGCRSIDNVNFNMNSVNSSNFSAKNFPGSDAVVFACFMQKSSKEFTMSPSMKSMDDAFANSCFQKFMTAHSYQPTMGSSKTMNVNSDKVNYFGVVGMGYESDISPKQANQFAKEVANMVKANKFKDMNIVFPEEMKNQAFFKSFMEAFYIAIFPHMLYTTKSSNDAFSNFNSCTFTMSEYFNSKFEATKTEAQAYAQGVYIAAEMVNAPPNYCNPSTMANMAIEIAEEAGFECKIMSTEEAEEHEMGAFVAVAKGSFFPAKFIHMTYKPTNSENCKKVFFVGKGITFDSGGYNLKSAAGMIDLMKFDMGGAAAVFGAAKTIGKIKPQNVEVHFVVPAAENMISSKAYRPGDIISASNGKTIEIGNTDAEGRLTLADALVYSERMGADYIIDIATLTGACMVALGMKYAGFFTSDDQFATDIKQCAEKAGELFWQLPMAIEYKDNFKSKIADMNNISKSPQGGAIIAALFLNEFVEKCKWVHMDIAGPVFDMEAGVGTGFAVRTLVQFAMKVSEQNN